MKHAALLAALLAASASGQELREGLNEMRQQGIDMMLTVYRRADVATWCEKNPEGEVTIQLDGGNNTRASFVLRCKTRREFLALLARAPQ